MCIGGVGKDKYMVIFLKLVFLICCGINLNVEDFNYDIK